MCPAGLVYWEIIEQRADRATTGNLRMALRASTDPKSARNGSSGLFAEETTEAGVYCTRGTELILWDEECRVLPLGCHYLFLLVADWLKVHFNNKCLILTYRVLLSREILSSLHNFMTSSVKKMWRMTKIKTNRKRI